MTGHIKALPALFLPFDMFIFCLTMVFGNPLFTVQ